MMVPGQTAASDPERSSAMSNATPIVFVVDDDLSVREALEFLVSFAGFEPRTFASAQAFLVRAARFGPQLPGARHELA